MKRYRIRRCLFGLAAVALTVAVVLAGCGANNELGGDVPTDTALVLTSAAFDDDGMITQIYTCDGQDISPPLSWEGAPEGTATLALIVDDPDAPIGTFVHWVIYNIPVDVTSLPEALPNEPASLDSVRPDLAGVRQGKNGFSNTGYGGPCPPSGTHRYLFKLYALDTELGLDAADADKQTLLNAMEGHALAQTTLTGRYQRQR